MRVTLRTRGLAPSGAISSHVERRLRVAAGRFESRLAAVRVRLADTNGPRGGEGSQFAPGPGSVGWMAIVRLPSALRFRSGVRLPMAYRSIGFSTKNNRPSGSRS